ncbi:DUF3421 domain containing protein [Asbolus verrucosus]|uniref:DUF3421 domain containing protein n=1 Tax=Asbolus verrucosus TaxID=1661398 RepID=A0A482W9Q5_ASBVE|nr:DUF3421 domain containing protein [Asbolus verrucosus]
MTTYIGQAYIHKLGIFVAQIYPGKKEVEAAAYGVKKTSMNIKILCVSNKNNFEWVPTNHTHFHVDMTDKIPVIGGFDFNGNKGMVHIGKVHFQGFLKVGEITSYLLENAQLHFPHNSAELSAKFYHVLVLRQLPVYDVRTPVAEILSKSALVL